MADQTNEPKGEFISDWEYDDEPCINANCYGRVRWRRWKRHKDGVERVLNTCNGCGESWWVDG